MSDFWNGSFDVYWAPPGAALLDALEIGYTERGVRVNFGAPAGFPVREDRWGDTIVEEFFLGVGDHATVTVESLNFKIDTAHRLREALTMIGAVKNAIATDIDDLTNPTGISRSETVGQPIVEGILDQTGAVGAGTLTLTAIRGKLLGPTSPFSIVFPLAIPIEPVDVLLTLRGPVRIPFGFRAWPRYVINKGWEYYSFVKDTSV